jgi:N-methylhydantoinase B
MHLDKVKLQVFADHARAVIEQVATTLQRTAYSAFVKEMKDFTSGLVTPDGQTFISSRNSSWFMGLDYKPVIDRIEAYEDGDICITNDPYSGFVCTHSPDTHVWKPVFHEGKLVCFVVSHIHNTDVGGAVPASLSRALTEIHQEGIRLPPSKLLRRGEVNRELVDLFLLNVRAPEQNWGDMKAQIAAMNTGAVQISKMIEKFGLEDFQRGIYDLLDYSEEQARLVIRSIPDGEYYFHDYIDEDSEGGPPCRLALNMIVTEDSIVFDFRKSDPQLGSAIHMPTGGHVRHTLLLIAMYYVLSTIRPNMLINVGVTRLAHCLMVEGSVLNPKFPAAVGMRSVTTIRLVDVLLGAFVQAVPKLPAASAGSNVIMNIRTFDPRIGRQVMAALNPMIGGGGAMPFSDGQNGSGGTAAALKNTPIEINEIEVPVRILRYQVAPDTGGAGKRRGGLGVAFEFEVHSPQTVITARNRDRTRFCGWGIYGGRAGKPSSFTLDSSDGKRRTLRNLDVVAATPGDIIRISSPGGGGYGSPLERPIDEVVADVACGFVTVETARNDYGVVIGGGKGTRLEIQDKIANSKTHANAEIFDFGPERDEFEAQWPRNLYDALIDFLMAMPIEWRFYLKHRVFDEVGTKKLDKAGLNHIFENVHEAFPQLAGETLQLADATDSAPGGAKQDLLAGVAN